jgi:hypothetical protein
MCYEFGVLVCGIFPFFVASCSKKEEGLINEEQKRELEARLERKKQEERDLLAEKELLSEIAKLKTEDELLKAKLLKEQLLIEAQAAEQKIADEEAKLREEDILSRQALQKVARNRYNNTKYEKLVLLDGKVLKSAKVTQVTPVKVTFIHQSGVARVKYSNLPEEIRLACKYDVELGTLELEKIAKDKNDRLASRSAKIAKRSNQRSNREEADEKIEPSYRRSLEVSDTTEEKVVKPRGKLSVRVVGTRKGSKTIKVIANSNVDAVLHLNDYWRPRSELRVKANVPFSHTWTRVKIKYAVKLSADGKVLDRESSGRKSGLGGNGGL